MREYSGTERVQQARARVASEKEFEMRQSRGWGDQAAALFSHARGLAFTADVDWDGERLPNVSGHKPQRRQNRAGQAKDIANAVAIGGAVNEAIAAAGPTQRRLLLTALDGAAPDLRKATAMAKRGRVNRLHGLRASVRTIIDHRHGAHGINDAQAEAWLHTLTLLQAEIAFYQDQRDADWHVHEIARVLPDHCERFGETAIRASLDFLTNWLDDLYGVAARHAVDNDVMIELPTLITSAEIGRTHRVSHVETRHVFPKGRHGIRAYDSTYVPPKRRTVEDAQGDAAYIREKDALAKFHGKSRRTVNRWASNPEKYAAKLAEMRAGLDPVQPERDAEPVTPVTPQADECPAVLIVDYKAERDTCAESVTNDNADLSRCPEFLRELAAWKGVKVASLRVYRKRGTLAALIAAYLDHLDDEASETAVVAMTLEMEGERFAGAA